MTSKTLSLFALLILSTFSYSQTQQFTATAVNVSDPPYGLVAQLWNGSTHTIYVDHIDVSGAPETTQVVTGGIFEFAFGFSYLEESQCKPIAMILTDPVNGPQLSTDNSIRASQQPCTPNGLPYGQPTGPNSWNYTPTNTAPNGVTQLPVLAFCNGLTCAIDYPAGLAILPGHGVTIYTAYYKDPNAFGWNGYASVNFRGRK